MSTCVRENKENTPLHLHTYNLELPVPVLCLCARARVRVGECDSMKWVCVYEREDYAL